MRFILSRIFSPLDNSVLGNVATIFSRIRMIAYHSIDREGRNYRVVAVLAWRMLEGATLEGANKDAGEQREKGLLGPERQRV